MLARSVNWAKLAKSLVENMVDPSHLFDWPFCRVVAVYLSEGLAPTVDLTDPSSEREFFNRKRAAKGLPPIEG